MLPSELQPAPGRPGYAIHAALLGVLLELQDILLTHHIPCFHGFFQIADTSQRVIGCIVAVPDKPAASPAGSYQLAVGGVLQVPGIIEIKPLKPPQLITLHHAACHLAEQRVHVAEPLGGIIEGYVIMAAGQDRIKKQRINIVPLFPS